MVAWHSSRLSPKPVTVTTHSLFPAEHWLKKPALPPSPLVSCGSWSPCCEIMGSGLCSPSWPWHSSGQLGHSELTAPSPAGENQGGFPNLDTAASAAEPSSHASRSRDFLQYFCDFLWSLGVHSQGLGNTLTAVTFPVVQVPLTPHHTPAIPRKLNPAEPMEAPLSVRPE